jgi:hypothetical protein
MLTQMVTRKGLGVEGWGLGDRETGIKNDRNVRHPLAVWLNQDDLIIVTPSRRGTPSIILNFGPRIKSA